MGLPRDRLEAPPRTITPALTAQMIFGGAVTQIGWLLFGFGSLFFWMFAWQADLSGWRFRPEAVGSVRGTILGCRDTHYTVGGSRTRRGTPVYENRYRYTVDGTEYDGRSYDTGRCFQRGNIFVQYLLAEPSYSRIFGMRRGILTPWALLAALFPAAGLVIATVGLWRARLRVRLLREGLPAFGVVKESTPTGSRVLGRPVYRVTLEFQARDGSTHFTRISTNLPERLTDDKQETILYDAEAPDRALPIDGLPGDLSVDTSGRILPDRSKAYLFLPAASILFNAWLANHYWR